MKVIEAMSHGYQKVTPSESIQRAAQLMREHGIGFVVVEEDGEVRGALTDRDITCRAVAEGRGGDTPVSACMSPEPLFCHTQDDIHQAVELMEREKVRRLIVRDLDEKPVGVLAQADVSAAIGGYGLAAEMLQKISQPGGKHSQQ